MQPVLVGVEAAGVVVQQVHALWQARLSGLVVERARKGAAVQCNASQFGLIQPSGLVQQFGLIQPSGLVA